METTVAAVETEPTEAAAEETETTKATVETDPTEEGNNSDPEPPLETNPSEAALKLKQQKQLLN